MLLPAEPLSALTLAMLSSQFDLTMGIYYTKINPLNEQGNQNSLLVVEKSHKNDN